MALLGSDYESSEEEFQQSRIGAGRTQVASTLVNPAPEVTVDVWSLNTQRMELNTNFQ